MVCSRYLIRLRIATTEEGTHVQEDRLATDGSDGADRALGVAKSIAADNKASLLAVHSVEYLAGKGWHSKTRTTTSVK